MAEQDFSEIARLAERYSKEPKSRIFVQLADAYRKNNMIDEALEVLQQGLQYHPQYPLAYLILGKCYFDKRMYAQSKDALEKTIEFDPINVVALRMLAQVCETLKDEACQLKAYKGIVAIDPSDEMARNKLQTLEAAQSKGPIYTITLAREYEKQGNLQEALNVYENLSFMDPTDLAIKEKIKELRNKISGAEEKTGIEEEQKVSELKLENYFKPEEVDIVAPQVDIQKPPDAALGEHIIDLSQEVSPPVVEVTEPRLEREEPKKTEEVEEVLSLEEFLVEPATSGETVKPELIPEEPAQPTIQIENVAEIKPAETIIEKPVEEPVIEPTPAIEEVQMVMEKPEPAPEEQSEILIEHAPEFKASEPETKPEPVAEAIPELQVEGVQPAAAEPVEKPVEEKPSEEKEEKPVEAEPLPSEEKPKDETPKPKEEDFKSFQDWLSSLLK